MKQIAWSSGCSKLRLLLYFNLLLSWLLVQYFGFSVIHFWGPSSSISFVLMEKILMQKITNYAKSSNGDSYFECFEFYSFFTLFLCNELNKIMILWILIYINLFISFHHLLALVESCIFYLSFYNSTFCLMSLLNTNSRNPHITADIINITT